MIKKDKNPIPASETAHKSRNLALQLRATGGVEVVEIGEKPALSRLQELCGGYIETVPHNIPVSDPIMMLGDPVSGPIVMLCDEEGKLKNKPINFIASAIMQVYPYDFCVGDALILGVDGEDFAGLTEDQVTVVKQIVAMLAKAHGCGGALQKIDQFL